MKKIKMFLGVVLVMMALVIVPKTSLADTTSDLQAMISALLLQVQQLQAQLNQSVGQTQQWCHTFNRNLKIGNRGSEVAHLHRALEKEGLGPFERGGDAYNAFNDFTAKTASAVSGFQNKYKKDILTPVGLVYGTGFVGPSTRAKLNQLYGCDSTVLPPPPIDDFCGGIAGIMCKSGYTCKYDGDYSDAGGKCVLGEKDDMCIQVITPAKDPKTGECNVFPNPCVVPKGWVRVNSCDSVKTAHIYDDFAQCLAKKEVTLYGNENWLGQGECRFCKRQRELFGDSLQYVPYVDCATNEGTCSSLGIMAYPTWILGNGSKIIGMQSLSKLAQKSDCLEALPGKISSSISVSFPNGGETFQAGNQMNIHFTSLAEAGDNVPIGIYLSGFDEFGGTYIAHKIHVGGSYFSSIGNTFDDTRYGSYSWTIPSSVKPGKYLIRVVAYPDDKTKSYEGSSNSPFSITGDTAVFSRDSRRISDMKKLQLALELYYDANGSYPTSLYSLAPKYISSVFSDPLGNMYHYLSLPYGCTAGYTSTNKCVNYHMGSSLESSDHPALGSDSDYDSSSNPGGITGADQESCRPIGGGISRYCYDVVINDDVVVSQPGLTVTSPNGGEVWKHGETHRVEIVSGVTGRVHLQLFRGDTYVKTIGEVDSAPPFSVQGHAYLWTIPSDVVVGSNYRIKAIKFAPSGTSIGHTYDFGDFSFSITADSFAPVVSLSSPSINVKVNSFVTLTGIVSGGSGSYKYYWDFHNGAKQSSVNYMGSPQTAHTVFSKAGVYNVTLKVIDSANNKSNTATHSVYVSDSTPVTGKPTVDTLSASKNVINSGEKINIYWSGSHVKKYSIEFFNKSVNSQSSISNVLAGGQPTPAGNGGYVGLNTSASAVFTNPSSVAEKQYFKVIAYGDNGQTFVKEVSFTVNPTVSQAQPSITVSSPSQPNSTLAVEGVIVPVTNFVIDPKGQAATIQSVTVSRDGLNVDGAIDKVVLMVGSGSHKGRIIALKSPVNSANGVNLKIDSSLSIKEKTSFTIGVKMKSSLSSYSGLTVNYKVVGVSAIVNKVNASIVGLPISGTSHTVNSSLDVGDLSYHTNAVDSITLYSSSVENILLKKIFILGDYWYETNNKVKVTGGQFDGYTYTCSNSTPGVVVCGFGDGIVIPRNGFMTLESLSFNLAGGPMSDLNIEAVGQTYGYRLPLTNAVVGMNSTNQMASALNSAKDILTQLLQSLSD